MAPSLERGADALLVTAMAYRLTIQVDAQATPWARLEDGDGVR